MEIIDRRFDFEGGSLTLRLESERRLDDGGREAIERIADQCRQYAARRNPEGDAATVDTAIDELGGQQGLTAG